MDFYKKIEELISKDSRYQPDAYEFVMQGLWFTQKRLKREGHLNGKELADGLRDFALEEYGPLAKTVLEHWGINATRDFGEIVFNMIENNLMSKTESDKREDFQDVYNFDTAFDLLKNKPLKNLG